MGTMILAAGETAGTLDISLVGTVINLCKECMSLFSIFPLNIFLISGLVGVGFMIFGQAKNAARG